MMIDMYLCISQYISSLSIGRLFHLKSLSRILVGFIIFPSSFPPDLHNPAIQRLSPVEMFLQLGIKFACMHSFVHSFVD